MQRAGVMVTPETLLQVDAVFTSMRIISNNMLKLGRLRAFQWQLWQDEFPYRRWLAEQPSVLTDMWGGRLLPSTGMDRTIWSMGLFGEAFWYVLLRDRLQRPLALDVLHPAFMDIHQDEGGEPIYLYGSGMDRKTLDPEDVIHIPFKSLPQARRALSPTKYAGVASALAMAAYEFGSSWFEQGASPDFILTTDAKLGQEEVRRIASKFLSGHAGLSKSHLPLVLDNGMKADKALNTPDEAQYLKTLSYARSVIGSWFGIPEDWLGNALQQSMPAAPHTLQEKATEFIQNTLSGYITPICEAASLRLLPTGVDAGWDESLLEHPDTQFLAQEVQALRMTQSATMNDVRVRKLHWAPLPDAAADQALAPLASNVAPSQTPSASSADDK